MPRKNNRIGFRRYFLQMLIIMASLLIQVACANTEGDSESQDFNSTPSSNIRAVEPYECDGIDDVVEAISLRGSLHYDFLPVSVADAYIRLCPEGISETERQDPAGSGAICLPLYVTEFQPQAGDSPTLDPKAIRNRAVFHTADEVGGSMTVFSDDARPVKRGQTVTVSGSLLPDFGDLLSCSLNAETIDISEE